MWNRGIFLIHTLQSGFQVVWQLRSAVVRSSVNVFACFNQRYINYKIRFTICEVIISDFSIKRSGVKVTRQPNSVMNIGHISGTKFKLCRRMDHEDPHHWYVLCPQRSKVKDTRNISQTDKATLLKFGRSIERGYFLPTDNRLSPKLARARGHIARLYLRSDSLFNTPWHRIL